MDLKYPKAFIIRCLTKAKKIRAASRVSQTRRRDERKKIIVVPGSRSIQVIKSTLRRAGMELIEHAGSKTQDLVREHKGTRSTDDSVVYKVPCGGCTKFYIGETYRGLKTRINEHRRDVRTHQPTSSFVMHVDQEGHLPKWDEAVVVWSGQGKAKRKIMESAIIDAVENINSKRGDFTIASALAKMIWKEC